MAIIVTDYGSDEDQESGDEEGEDDDLIEIENSYYEGDDYIKEDPKRAVELFEKVVELETARGDEVTWRFKALQKLVKVHFNLKEYSKMIGRYRDMLVYMSEVTKNEPSAPNPSMSYWTPSKLPQTRMCCLKCTRLPWKLSKVLKTKDYGSTRT